MAAGDLISSRGGIAGSGVVTGAVITSGAMVFDGVDDYVKLGALYPVTSACLWVKNNLGGDQYYYLEGEGLNKVWGIRTTNVVNIYEGTWKSFSYTPSINWEHHCIVYNVDHYDLYVNGTYKSSASASDKISIDLISGKGTNSMNGSINNVLIFNISLTQSEVTAIYNAGKDAYSPVTDGLIAQYSGRDYYGTAGAPIKIYNAIYPPNEPLKTHIDQMNLPTVTDKFICLPRVGRNNSFYAFAVNREA
jgi:hypothetical protein